MMINHTLLVIFLANRYVKLVMLNCSSVTSLGLVDSVDSGKMSGLLHLDSVFFVFTLSCKIGEKLKIRNFQILTTYSSLY